MSSEVAERKPLISLVLSNLQVKDEKVLYDVRKTFDAIMNCKDDQACAPCLTHSELQGFYLR